MRIILIFLLLSNIALGSSDTETKIRNYIANIDQSQKEIAGHLALRSFSRFFIDAADSKELDDQLNYFFTADQSAGFNKISNDFFDLIYSDTPDKEKINSAVQLLIHLRKDKRSWVSVGGQVRSATESFYNSIHNEEYLCSEESFADALAGVKTNLPSGLDTSKFGKEWQLSFSGYVSNDSNGNLVGGGSVSSSSPSSSGGSGNEREAVATTVGAIVSLCVPCGGPLAGAAAALVVEVVWGMVDMHHKVQELEAVARANQDLYASMRFEVNVKKHYDDYCMGLKQAYTEVKPLILESRSENGRRTLDAEIMAARLFVPELNQNAFKSSETFYHYTKYMLLNQAKFVNSSDEQYFSSWNQVIQNLDNVTGNIEKSISQIIAQKYKTQYKGDVELITKLIKQVESLDQFKKGFYSSLFAYFETNEKSSKMELLNSMKNLVQNYSLYHDDVSSEEFEVIKGFTETIAKLEAKNA
jgi:hypothetical protein